MAGSLYWNLCWLCVCLYSFLVILTFKEKWFQAPGLAFGSSVICVHGDSAVSVLGSCQSHGEVAGDADGWLTLISGTNKMITESFSQWWVLSACADLALWPPLSGLACLCSLMETSECPPLKWVKANLNGVSSVVSCLVKISLANVRSLESATELLHNPCG